MMNRISNASGAHGFISRQEAVFRLRQLRPGSEEYCQLQNALFKTPGIVQMHLPHGTYKVNTFVNQLRGGFGASEHMSIGRSVQLKGLPNEDSPLMQKGITPIYFCDILALAGDHYGVVGKPISLLGGTNEEKTSRFEACFNALAETKDNYELQRVLGEIKKEYIAVKNTGLPQLCYSDHLLKGTKALEEIKNDFMDLLIDNSDHFSVNARDAYRIGHNLALKIAKESKKTSDLKVLKYAYAIDAFACHFLSDLFAAGHTRNQRGELEIFLSSKLGFSENWAKKFSGVLTFAQHEKDGNEGLNVYDEKGGFWRAYGDGSFFTPKNKKNREKVIAAIQASLDEVYNAFHSEKQESSKMEQYIPYASDFNPLPIYKVKEGSLFLYQGDEQVAIKTQEHFIQSAILTHAIQYLPQEYILGFLGDYIKKFNPISQISPPAFIEKAVIPQVQRITASIWQIAGAASFLQIKQETKKLNQKIDETADLVRSAYENTEEILSEIKIISSQLDELVWSFASEEIKNAISAVKDMVHQQSLFKEILSKQQVKETKKKCWDAYLRLSRVFSSSVERKTLFEAYRKKLPKEQYQSEESIRISVTLWFRQMLDYQIVAFGLYCSFQALEGNNKKIQKQIIQFESQLKKQIEDSKEYVELDLLSEEQEYISLQLKKCKTKWIAFKQLQKIK